MNHFRSGFMVLGSLGVIVALLFGIGLLIKELIEQLLEPGIYLLWPVALVFVVWVAGFVTNSVIAWVERD